MKDNLNNSDMGSTICNQGLMPVSSMSFLPALRLKKGSVNVTLMPGSPNELKALGLMFHPFKFCIHVEK